MIVDITGIDWGAVTCLVDDGIGSDTWTNPGTTNGCAALLDFVDWYSDPSRPWTDTAAIVWSQTDGSAAVDWELATGIVVTYAWSTDAQAALGCGATDDAGTMPGSIQPDGGWGMSAPLLRRGLQGRGGAQGTMRPGLAHWGPVRPVCEGLFDFSGALLLQEVLARSANPRRCWVQDTGGTWRQYALGQVSRERRSTLWAVTLELAGDAL